ncbi:MAG: STAS domain-containing protein [Actinobacteria bacterium]|nr:STAS domain-containing protein [Actinomycetota bacterium]MCA1706924.1 STAS domain-containing protein [Actinomycetota bacterium]
MSVQPKLTTGSGDIPHRAVTIGDINGSAAWCALSCTTRSLLCSAGEIIVLQVKGEVDLGTLPILQAALGDSLDRHPARLIVDLARMTFCFARGLDLLTQTRYTTADKASSYVVSSVPPQIDCIWALAWDGDLPIRHRSTAAAMTATIQAGE